MFKKSTALDTICAHRKEMKVIIAVLIVCGLLLGFSGLFVRPGDDVWPILVIDGVLVGGSFVAFCGMYWYCTKRAMDE